jgi:hypothetical protein
MYTTPSHTLVAVAHSGCSFRAAQHVQGNTWWALCPWGVLSWLWCAAAEVSCVLSSRIRVRQLFLLTSS